jgi:hypothetical protein
MCTVVWTASPQPLACTGRAAYTTAPPSGEIAYCAENKRQGHPKQNNNKE